MFCQSQQIMSHLSNLFIKKKDPPLTNFGKNKEARMSGPRVCAWFFNGPCMLGFLGQICPTGFGLVINLFHLIFLFFQSFIYMFNKKI
jgi:hypothetical protein